MFAREGIGLPSWVGSYMGAMRCAYAHFSNPADVVVVAEFVFINRFSGVEVGALIYWVSGSQINSPSSRSATQSRILKYFCKTEPWLCYISYSESGH